MNICSKIYSCFPGFNWTNFNRLALGTIGIGASLLGGLPLAAISMGTCYYLKKRWFTVQTATNNPPIPSSGGGRLSREVFTSLERPSHIKRSAHIVNQGNSCFCSSVLWSFFTNEPLVQEGLPHSIARKIEECANLREPPTSWWQKALAFKEEPIFSEIRNILTQNEPFNLTAFDALRIRLQSLEQRRSLASENRKAFRELLSLLELHDLIQEFQNSSSMMGGRVNSMRNMAARVNHNFEGTGTQTGDAQEIFQILAGLIFANSKTEQMLSNSYYPQRPKEPNWGSLDISLKPNASIAETFKKEYWDRKFPSPPPFLAININRHSQDGSQMRFDPVIADLEFELPKWIAEANQTTRYELVGASRRLPDKAHYDALWKQGGQWYSGDDLCPEAVCPFEESFLSEALSTGYLFFYRLKK